MPRQIRGLGWIPDLPDHRDHLYSAPMALLRRLPQQADLRPQCPPIYDQGRIGSCTANAIAAAIQFDRLKKGQSPDFVPSRLFIYYNERRIEGHVAFDSGAQLRDGIKSVHKQGVCPEEEWPYDDTPAEEDGGPFPAGSRPATKPPHSCYRDAVHHHALQYQRLAQTLSQLKGCLASGYPFVFGFTVYSSFFEAEGKQKLVIPFPSDSDAVLGGHAVLGVGYDDATNRFTIRNSWGPGQADGGYFYMPYGYLTDSNLSSDFWTIRTVSG